jgi:hypothetical protein
MPIDALFIIAKSHDTRVWLERDESNDSLENLYKSIELRLHRWIESISDEKRALYKDRIQRPIDCIKNKSFTIESIWLNASEVTIAYCDPTADPHTIQIRLILTPRLILIQDIEYGKKEIAFPILV